MSNDFLPVFLYRWDDETPRNDGGSCVAFGESRQVQQHYPSVLIGVATRPVGEPIEHMDTAPAYEARLREEFVEHVESVSDDVRWFDDPLDCRGETDD